MCGRFSLTMPPVSITELFSFYDYSEFKPRYNIAPGQSILTVRVLEQGRPEVSQCHWGFTPRWATYPSKYPNPINARIETVSEKPMFRHALKQNRCLILADGFYEWKNENNKKQPYRIVQKDQTPFAMAGLWEEANREEGGKITGCTILTQAAQGPAKDIHSRMPVIVPQESMASWLSNENHESNPVMALIKSFKVPPLHYYPVSTMVDSGKVDVAECIEPLTSSE